ncbi:MAG: SDR family NAD(P)-dependent oxidoreductase [Myxococcota bacterium]|nr:SDR family NAD(P)-dependent oxidoreductase [Myxococcota bacterium]
MNHLRDTSVAIFGATSRLSHALALEYGRLGYAIFLAARDIDEGERIAKDVEIRTGTKTCARKFDALDYPSHSVLVDTIGQMVGPPSVAIVAFGDMGDHSVSKTNFEAARKVLEINYTGAVSICEAMASVFESRGSGSVVGLSSVAGERGRQSNYFYGSAKGAFTLYLQGLAHRLAKSGAHAMTVKLGFVDTRMTYGLESAIPVASPERAARAIVKAQQKQCTSMYYPTFWKPVMSLIRMLPSRVVHRTDL